MRAYIKLMRMHHYIKNLLVFSALICSGSLFQGGRLWASFSAFLAFCQISSVVYVVNDLMDVEKDRNHPTKCNRPIASGAVSKRNAMVFAAILCIGSLVCNYLSGFSWAATGVLLLYFALNLAYSIHLKNVPLVDVAILASGFVLRPIYGSFASRIPISDWLYLTVFACSFYFALGKRRNELTRNKGKDTRMVLKIYNERFLDKNMYMCMALANVFYALWTLDERTAAHYHGGNLVITVPIVMLITMKYSLDIEGDSDGDPVEVLLHDKILIGLCLIYAIVMFSMLYL